MSEEVIELRLCLVLAPVEQRTRAQCIALGIAVFASKAVEWKHPEFSQSRRQQSSPEAEANT